MPCRQRRVQGGRGEAHVKGRLRAAGRRGPSALAFVEFPELSGMKLLS